MKELRKLGDILLDIEPYLLEMADQDLQWGDYFSLLRGYLEVHLRSSQEEYTDDTRPVFFYGHIDDFIAEAERLKRVHKKD